MKNKLYLIALCALIFTSCSDALKPSTHFDVTTDKGYYEALNYYMALSTHRDLFLTDSTLCGIFDFNDIPYEEYRYVYEHKKYECGEVIFEVSYKEIRIWYPLRDDRYPSWSEEYCRYEDDKCCMLGGWLASDMSSYLPSESESYDCVSIRYTDVEDYQRTYKKAL